MDADVVVVGAGPVGLMLASELALCGVRPVVVERRSERSQWPKANGLGGRIVRLLEHRGLRETLAAEAPYAGPVPQFPFGPVPLDLTGLDEDERLQVLLIQQPRLEELLEEHARGLGVEIRRGQRVTGLTTSSDGVRLELDGPGGAGEISTAYAVGCDGAGSVVRQRAGIAFEGTTGHEVTRLAHFATPSTVGVFDREVELPGLGRIPTDWTEGSGGSTIVTSLHPGVLLVAVREPVGPDTDPDTDPGLPATLEELKRSFERVFGAELPLTDPLWVSRTVPQGRLADRYRAGPVLLAGDAAHLFLAGGAALNAGLLDAMNLGWKLAATVEGWAPPGLLDSYHEERHAVGARTLMHTSAQAALDRAEGQECEALRQLFGELASYAEPLRLLANLLQGVDVRHDQRTAAHPAVGRFAPDLELTTAEGSATTLARAMRDGRAVLIDLADRPAVRAAAADWSDRVETVVASTAPASAPADLLLVRPDAVVAWACESEIVDEEAAAGLRAALETWFGTPGRAARATPRAT